MGEGHNRSAQALRQGFLDRGHDCDVVDALRVAGDEAGPVSGSSSGSVPARRTRSDVSSALYGWAAFKVPALFGAVYNAGALYSRTGVPSPIRASNARYAAATHAYIQDHHYDSVVSTHTFPCETLGVVRRQFPSSVKYYGVLTDYTCTPFFAEPALDGFCVPHADLLPGCVKQGLPAGATYATGLPVAARFRQPLDQAAARASLGLPADGALFLVMAGGVGGRYLTLVGDALIAEPRQYTCVVILTGRREDLYQSVTARYETDPRVTVVPFTERVPDYMAAADVLVTKPGGVSSTEAAAMGLPLVHTGAIPGCEVENARFFGAHDLSVYNQHPAEAARLAHWLLDDDAKVARMRAHQGLHIPGDGADRIVTLIEDHA
jgi:processive 1,2-diacylglycerol beta-glucosyltransferase